MSRITKGYAIGVFAAVALAGCGGSGGGADDSPQPELTPTQPPAGDTGLFSLNVSDAPIRDAVKVCVRFDGVELKHADSDDRETIDFDAPEVVNLIANQGANSQPIIVGAELPAGEYEWIRLKVQAERGLSGGANDMDPDSEICDPDTENSYLVRDSGALNNLFIPSGSQRGLQLIKDIIVPANRTGAYTAEWDLGKSFNGPPGLLPDVMMKPVVKLVANNEVGTLVGRVDDELIALESCDADFAPSVYVFDDGVTPNPLPEDGEFDETDATATGLVEERTEDDGSVSWRYSIGFLLAGNYEVAYTCNGNDFVPLAGKPAEIVIDEVTTVDFLADDAPGTLSGQVADAFFDDAAPESGFCALPLESDTGATAAIYVFEGGVEPGPDAVPVATGAIAEEVQPDESTQLRYSIALQAGNYTAALSCTDGEFIPATGKAADIVPAGETIVDFLTEDAPAPTGSLGGTVTSELVTACEAGAEASVYAFAGDVTPAGDIEPAEIGIVTMDMSTELYGYLIDPIVAGTYTAAFTCDGTSFEPADGQLIDIAIGEAKTVDFENPAP